MSYLIDERLNLIIVPLSPLNSSKLQSSEKNYFFRIKIVVLHIFKIGVTKDIFNFFFSTKL